MRGPRWLRRRLPWLLCLCAALYLTSPLLLYAALVSRDTHAQHAGGLTLDTSDQDVAWVVRKNAFQIARPLHPGETVVPSTCAAPCISYPIAYTLDTGVVSLTLEPNPQSVDAAGHAYLNHDMTKLCGPAAAANALYFWGMQINTASPGTFVDPSNGVATYWTNQDNRAAIMYLAWRATIPSASHLGMMDTHYPSNGVTLYGMRDGLNWEASGQNTANWRTYFYTVTWWNQSSAADFHHKVVDDVARAHVPVVAEVSARLLPNWAPKGNTIYHFITIVGYDDTKGVYLYTDTCGHSTHCGSLSDGGVHSVPQQQMWDAITAIPVNTSPDYNAGDGGFVW
ncbi:MAG: hypothetical protein OJF49_002034 [Ktedonobacterales bacterium]|jgi:hypothetical protein|nr:MAG: hypothetical protein OJF49_002034 [Ktedonobacterales bacterium]